MAITITPLNNAAFGAQLSGWNPGELLSENDIKVLQAGLRDHLLLLLRGHTPASDEQLVGLARQFGEVAKTADLSGVAGRHPEILVVGNEPNEDGTLRGVAGSGVLPWHCDYSFLPRPAQETFLDAVVLPDKGGVTSFCNLYSAWDSLAAPVREKLKSKSARHSHEAYFKVRHDLETEDEREATANEHWDESFHGDAPSAEVWHPVAFPHPVLGKLALYIDSLVCDVEGLTSGEAGQLRDDCIAMATASENVYRHEWQLGDLIIFDAIGGLHCREPFDAMQTRTMRQISTLVPVK